MSILRKIKHIVGHREYVEPIIDANIYPDMGSSYAGGSLAESNILLVTNTSIPEDLVCDIEKNENVSVSVLTNNLKLTIEDIVMSGNSLIGPFTHIINIYSKDKDMSLLTSTGHYPETDDMYNVYQWLQEEVEYLVPLSQGGTICTAYISNETEYAKVLEKNMEMIALSLGSAMSNHSIINNGIVVSGHVPLIDILHTAMFMSSKYGQILGGTIHLKA